MHAWYDSVPGIIHERDLEHMKLLFETFKSPSKDVRTLEFEPEGDTRNLEYIAVPRNQFED